MFLQLFLPCTQLYVLLSLAGHLSSKDLFSKALELLEQGMRWGSKALLGVVLGFHVLQGMIAPYTDSVRQTTLRRAVSLIPGIGQGAAAVSQVLLGSSVLIRNTAVSYTHLDVYKRQVVYHARGRHVKRKNYQ